MLSVVPLLDQYKTLPGHVRIHQVINHVLQIIPHLLSVETISKKEQSSVMEPMVLLLERCVPQAVH